VPAAVHSHAAEAAAVHSHAAAVPVSERTHAAVAVTEARFADATRSVDERSANAENFPDASLKDATAED
jgi:hypothetical protein